MTNTPPIGFTYIPDFLTRNEGERLVAAFPQRPTKDNHGVRRHRPALSKRWCIDYGYDYSPHSKKASSVASTSSIADFLVAVPRQVAQAFDVHPEEYVQIILTYYPKGVGLHAAHVDAPVFAEPILGLSLVGAARFVLRAVGEPRRTWNTVLEPRSLYAFAGDARWHWKHSVDAVDTERFSLTFRALK